MIETPHLQFRLTAGYEKQPVSVIAQIDIIADPVEKDILKGFITALFVLQKETSKHAVIFKERLHFHASDIDDLPFRYQSAPAFTAQSVFLEKQRTERVFLDLPVTIETFHR
jgi:hypothetical protein